MIGNSPLPLDVRGPHCPSRCIVGVMCTNSHSDVSSANIVGSCAALLAVSPCDRDDFGHQVSVFYEPTEHPLFGVPFPTEIVAELASSDSGGARDNLNDLMGLRPKIQH